MKSNTVHPAWKILMIVRRSTGYSDPKLNVDWFENASSASANPLEIHGRYDLSSLGTDLRYFDFYASAYKTSPLSYEVWTRLDEPFFGGSYNSDHMVDISRTYRFANVGYNNFIDYNGDGKIDNDEPYISMYATADCEFKAGVPLVRIK